MHFNDLTAVVEVTWNSTVAPSLDIQIAGTDGVLRIETDPLTQLEQNGSLVPLPVPAAIAPELQPFRDAGVINMLQTIGAAFHNGHPLAHAFSFEFGRSVVAIVETAEALRPTPGSFQRDAAVSDHKRLNGSLRRLFDNGKSRTTNRHLSRARGLCAPSKLVPTPTSNRGLTLPICGVALTATIRVSSGVSRKDDREQVASLDARSRI
jgi:hypothetical protein